MWTAIAAGATDRDRCFFRCRASDRAREREATVATAAADALRTDAVAGAAEDHDAAGVVDVDRATDSSSMSVSTKPGQTALTVTPVFAFSAASARISPTTPCFAAT